MKISIVMPFYGKWELCLKRLSELWAHSLQAHLETDVIIIDDCSPDKESYEGNIKWWQDGPLKGRLWHYRNKENKGFGGSMNRGVEIAIKHGADAIIFLSNDVTVMGDCVKDVATLLDLDKNIVIGGEVLYNDTGWNVLEGCGPVPYANGWFLAVHKDAWERLGGFDPNIKPFDAEDLDLSTSAWWNGVKLVTVGTKLKHAGGQTISSLNKNRQLITMKNIQYWRSKWEPKAGELKEKIYGKQE